MKSISQQFKENVEFIKMSVAFAISQEIRLGENKHLFLSILDNDIERLEEKLLKIEETNSWTKDSVKIQSLPGDALAYNLSIEEEIIYLKEQRELIANEK